MQRFIILLCALVLSSLAGMAQKRSGIEFHGQVTDQAGSAVEAARVLLKPDSKETRVEETNGVGHFTFTGLAPGRYRIIVESTGFANYQDEIVVTPSNPAPINIVLSVATLKSGTEVNGERNDLSTEMGPHVTVLRGSIIKRLPRNEQQLMQLLERMTGGFGGKLQISVNGLPGARLPPLATIKEIRINNDPFSAAYHEPGIARVEIETKSGNEQTQASLYLNYRNGAFDARNTFSPIKPALEHRDVGGWWSSKLFGQRSFIFGLLERHDHNETTPVTAYLPDGQFNANVPTPSKNTLLSLRADFLPTDRHTISLLFNHDGSWQRGPEITSLDLPDRSFLTRPAEQSLQTSSHVIFSKRLINDAQLRFVRERSESTTDNPEAAIEVAGAFNGGGPQCCPERHQGERISFTDNLILSSAQHLLKTGVHITGAHLSDLSKRDFGGTYYYASLSFYRLRRPLYYTISAGEPSLGFGIWQFAAYLQDEIRLTPTFTLSPGIRYETQTHLEDRNNFAPRLGFAWSPFKGRKTVVRGGAGTFYQQLEEGQLAPALRYDGNRTRQVFINRPRLPDPLGGNPITSFPISINKLAPDLRTPYQVHTSIGVEQSLAYELSLTLRYNYIRGVHLFRSRDVNAPPPGSFLRPQSRLGRVSQLESSSTSTYHSLTLGFSQSIGERFSLFGNYTLSRAVDDADGPDSSPMDSYNLAAERGFSLHDERHQLFIGSLFTLPFGFEASPMVYLNTGRPYNIITGFDDNGDSVINDRPAGVRRNSRRGPNYATVDFRLSKAFSYKRRSVEQQLFGIEFAAEATNLFNRVNFAGFNGIQTSPFFGRANAAHNPREITLQINFYFH